ncbi:hypothetical protein H310_12082 [Aphanomyces invadans]|uniref:Guanine nucleotide-binding protein-like 1 n=1 Tax=Aphanomyces invadans TaxID=157072 RepID=A0A024TL31_9STRA|nr:hypothetical protein H310_12082 [Aphanomyces invadans]ETV94047.1 hypothetical protein H310_12082 [Aphanomyces invadans]|eukprot:XP_008877250.1 hypothetical protein H310_12082 [Aphanomyces invadans]
MTKGKPFSGKLKKQQLQAKREKKAQKEKHAAAKYDAERDELVGLASSAPPMSPMDSPPMEYVSVDVGYSGDLRTIFAKESQAAIDARKKDATRPLVMAPDRGNSQSIYAYGLTDVRNQPPIPIRPHWTKHMSPDELAMSEEDAFRAWLVELHETCVARRQGARADAAINSYERNLQVWRQLWRVIEKSNVLVHLADCRCPLLHLSHRLIRHIQQDHPGKRVLILLTKCDFVAPERVDAWVQYIQHRYNVPVLPYNRDRVHESNAALLQAIGKLSEGTSFAQSHRDGEENSRTLMVGLVGEPNVGKSSFLNSLFLKKLVSVSATPGHTKHFQTHFYDNPALVGREDVDKVCLCDCPGVVFPRFGIPLALQILFGSYPIAQTREPYSAVRFVAENASPSLQHVYKLRKVDDDDEWSPFTVAEAYAAQRGFHSKGGKLDVFRAANLLLRHTLNGEKVVLTFPPPPIEAPTMAVEADNESRDGMPLTTNQVTALFGDMGMTERHALDGVKCSEDS